ncbi:hypothetical protein [Terricaulis sp.]|uniref:hypothetical protein n=1 Tax=Terricaulis sp. TaxID=2768686 RepID=UPI002AC3EE62|nr:hypothetical protein [Terricaulis sp.]MDZ4690169.1 hypothetical protein [Terricaulis sp.]
MQYRLVYDAAEAGYQGWPFVVIGLIFTAIGAVLVFDRDSLVDPHPARGCFVWGFFLFSLVWTVVSVGFTGADYFAARNASTNGGCTEVAGPVTDYETRRRSRATVESFSVDGVSFEYRERLITGGFNQTARSGGPIRPGLPVKACYIQSRTSGNVIVRLEVGAPR